MSTKTPIPAFATPWDISNREALLEALVHVIREEWPWLRTVRRQSLERECLAEPELPAVLIDEAQTDYSYDHRHHEHELRANLVVVFDLQVQARKTKAKPLGDVPTIREIMVSQLLRVLQNNAALKTLLPAVSEADSAAQAENHAIDAFNGCTVRYVKSKFPTVRALVTVRMLTSENFKERPTVDFSSLIMTAGPGPDQPGLTATFELDNPNS